MQPVRWYKPGATPDWLTYFPNLDNITHRARWIEGVWNTDYYSDWLINKQMSIQLRAAVTGNEDLSLYKYNTTTESYDLLTTVSPTIITPTGWVSEQVNRYDYTFSSAGTYYFDSSTAGYRSDKFVVHSDLKYRRRLIEVVYYNSFNDYGMVFFDGLTQRYTGRAYMTGGLFPETGNEISAFETDRGEISKQRATPLKSAMLKITEVHYAEIARINTILSCDNLTINGMTFQNSEAPEMERIEGTDLVKFSVKLRKTNYEYFIS